MVGKNLVGLGFRVYGGKHLVGLGFRVYGGHNSVGLGFMVGMNLFWVCSYRAPSTITPLAAHSTRMYISLKHLRRDMK
jgi:hypothetical protein